MTDDDSGALGGAPPKLTIGQRILTALPTLQRPPAPAPRTPPAPRPGRPPRSPAPRGGGDTPKGESRDDQDNNDDDSGNSTGGAATDGAATDGDATDGDATDRPAGGATTGGGSRLSTLLNPGATGGRTRAAENLDEMTREEITHRIKRLDDRERFLALSAAPFGVAVGVLLTVVAIHLNPSLMLHGKPNPKHESTSLILLEGGVRLALSGVVVACALTRRRSLVGFALLFLGTSMGSPLFALPFWALGGYLIWRVFKYQRVLTARGGAQRRASGPKRVPDNPRVAGRAGAAAARERAQARRRSKKEPAPTGPPPSKRYTPPRPARPRPPAPPS